MSGGGEDAGSFLMSSAFFESYFIFFNDPQCEEESRHEEGSHLNKAYSTVKGSFWRFRAHFWVLLLFCKVFCFYCYFLDVNRQREKRMKSSRGAARVEILNIIEKGDTFWPYWASWCTAVAMDLKIILSNFSPDWRFTEMSNLSCPLGRFYCTQKWERRKTFLCCDLQ